MSENTSRRLITKAVVFAVCLAAVVLIVPGARLAFNASQFREHGDASAFLYVYQSLRSGDTMERIEGLLGTGQPNHDPKYREACKKAAEAAPDQAPSGFLDEDVLMGYSAGMTTIHLQFRDGQLVNHTPTISPFMSSLPR